MCLGTAAIGLYMTASAQDFSSLATTSKVISVNAGPDQTVEAGVGTVNFHATMTGYVSESPVTFYWINQTTNQVDELGQDASMMAPRADTTYRLVAWNFDNGDWGESFFTVHVTDTTAPQIWLLGNATVWLSVCQIYGEAGWGVFDNADGTSVPVTVTGQVDTTTVGSYVLTYTATDSHNNSTSVIRTVNVIYDWSGFDQPVDPMGKSIFKLGSTIPLQFALTGACTDKIDLQAKLFLAKVSNGIAGTEIAPSTTSAADSGNVFKYLNGKYKYNLSTKGLSSGTWQLRVDLGDGAMHAYTISLSN